MSYLMHFNRNHGRKDGRFVSGDGDGDGNPNDHKVYDVGNKRYVDAKGHPITASRAAKERLASKTITIKSGSNNNSASSSDSKSSSSSDSTKKVTVGTNQSDSKAEVTIKNDTQEQKTSSNISPTKYGGNINADGSMVRIDANGKVQLANVGGVKSIMRLMTDDFAERKKAKEEAEEAERKRKEAEELAKKNAETPISKVSYSSSGKSYVSKATQQSTLTEEEAAAKRKAKFKELENYYKPKEATASKKSYTKTQKK